MKNAKPANHILNGRIASKSSEPRVDVMMAQRTNKYVQIDLRNIYVHIRNIMGGVYWQKKSWMWDNYSFRTGADGIIGAERGHLRESTAIQFVLHQLENLVAAQ